MSDPEPGSYPIGPSNGELLVRTTCEGAMAAMGHNLTLIVERWDGVLVIGEQPEQCSLEMTAQLDSLRVREAAGGAKPHTASDVATIEKNAQSGLETARHPTLSFTSTAVTGAWDAGQVTGQAELHGQRKPVQFEVVMTADGYRLTGRITQSEFGVKPFSTMLGALRLADTVTIEATVRL